MACSEGLACYASGGSSPTCGPVAGCGTAGQPCCGTGAWVTRCVQGDAGASGTGGTGDANNGGYGCFDAGGTAMCGACGGTGEPCCATAEGWARCAPGLGCYDVGTTAVCGLCGASGQPCCDNGALPCGMGLGCFLGPVDGAAPAPVCGACGGVSQPCCTSGTPCNTGLACAGAACQ